jgi:uncharacterized protein YbjT (DUF2867 family)
MILVTGASGNAGGAVLKEVLKTNRPVRAMYRSPANTLTSPKHTGKAYDLNLRGSPGVSQ